MPHVYRFGTFRLDPEDRVLWDGQRIVPLAPKAFDLLMALVEAGGRVVSKDQLMAKLWPDTFVEEANLTHQAYKIREALRRPDDTTGYIETLSRRGYRFAAPIAEEGAQTPESTTTIRTVAVLPFTLLSPEAHSEILEIGMTDAVITKLTEVRQIVVRPTSAILKYRGAHDPIAAGVEQRVDAVLEGKVQQAGADVRVTVQLLRVKDGHLLWAGTFDERLGTLFAIQDAISSGVASSLASTLQEADARPSIRSRVNEAAYEAYLKGAYHAESFAPGGFARSISYFEEALRLQPDYALALAGLAFAYVEMAFADMAPDEAVPKARHFVRRALDADDTVSEVQRAAAIVATYLDWNWEEGERGFVRTIELAPGSAVAHNWYGWFLALAGRFGDAAAALAQARFLDPLSLTTSTAIGLNLLWAGDNERAIGALEEVFRFAPSYAWARIGLGLAFERLGRFEAALTVLDGLEKPWIVREAVIGFVHARAGHRDEAQRILNELPALAAPGAVPSFQLAQVHAGLGNLDDAFAALEAAFAKGSVWMSWLRIEPTLDPLRRDPRFATLLLRQGVLAAPAG